MSMRPTTPPAQFFLAVTKPVLVLARTMRRWTGKSSATSSAIRSTPGPQDTSESTVPQATQA